MAGGRVLVHCVQGISRSSTIVISYLMLTQNLNYEDALKFVESRRKIVSPNLGFSIQAQIFYKRICNEHLKYNPKVFNLGFISMTSKTVVPRYVSIILIF